MKSDDHYPPVLGIMQSFFTFINFLQLAERIIKMTSLKESGIRILFFGTSELGIPALRLLVENPRFEIVGVVTPPDKPAGRGLKLKAPALKITALELRLNLLQPASLKTPDSQARIRDLKPDIIATAAYGQWIPVEVFDLPVKRSLNMHPSFLPRHRGAAPVVSTILSSEKEVGISVLFVEDEMDAGDILAQIKLPIFENESTESVMKRCAEAGGQFFVNTLTAWADGLIRPKPQNHYLKTWFGRMNKSLGLIDWSLPAADIELRCRALTPWPGTYTFFKGQRLLIHQASEYRNPTSVPIPDEPGMVICIDSQVCIITGNGLLHIELIQLSCRKKLKIEEFINGQHSFIGTCLGNKEE
jgi:methionyl-tRNA formyltransferase